MTTPTPLREALATALHDALCVTQDHEPGEGNRRVNRCTGVEEVLAHPSMQAVVEHEWTDSALDLQTERDLAEAYYPTLERHLREHGCDHDFAEVANADGVLEGERIEAEEHVVGTECVIKRIVGGHWCDTHGRWAA